MKSLLVAVFSWVLAQPLLAQSDLATIAERSRYESTATHAQVMELCQKIAAASDRVQLSSMGTTIEDRDQPLLVISKQGLHAPERIQRDKQLCVFAMGNIHAGEVCGKEALLALAREFALGEHVKLLDRVVLLVAPIYNADGNERFSTENRPGQVGPANGMGQRRNAQALDLNRDHIKLESAEARNLARLCTEWDPHILIDCHTTNGSIHGYTITYDSPRHPSAPPRLIEYARDEMLPEIDARMESATGYKSFYYGNFSRDASLWESYPDLPRYSTHYFGLRGRIGLLSEAYSYAKYEDRILATKAFVLECVRVAHDNHLQIHELTSDQPRNKIALRSEPTPLPGKVEVLGNSSINPYDTDQDLSAIEMQVHSMVYMGGSKATQNVAPPFAYAFPAHLRRAAKNLAAHGIEVGRVEEEVAATVETYVVTDIKRQQRSFQGHRHIELNVTPLSQSYTIPSGWFVVKTDQRLRALLVYLLEPTAADGLASWNFFDAELDIGKPYPIVRVPEKIEVSASPATFDQTPDLQFAIQESGVDASLRGLDVVDQETAWASGTEGTVIKTVDGGATWQNVSIAAATECDFRDIEAFGRRDAIVVSAGAPARVYLTKDGGETWNQTYENEDKRIFFDAMGFWNRDDGVAFSDPVDGRLFLIRTRDGGRSWSELPLETCPETLDGEAGFAASGTCLVTLPGRRVLIGLGGATRNGKARVLRSDDLGETWQAASSTLKSTDASGIFSLAMCDPVNGVAVGGDYQSPDDRQHNVLVTRDGGESWRFPFGTRPGGYRSCVAVAQFEKLPVLIAVGTNGCDVSTDLGDSWQSAESEAPSGGFHAVISSPVGDTGWAVGGNGRVARWTLGD